MKSFGEGRGRGEDIGLIHCNSDAFSTGPLKGLGHEMTIILKVYNIK
jgi:hypothetical protein